MERGERGTVTGRHGTNLQDQTNDRRCESRIVGPGHSIFATGAAGFQRAHSRQNVSILITA